MKGVEEDRDSDVSKNVWKDFCFDPMSAKDKFDCLLAKVIKISSAKSKVRGSIRHNTKDISIEAGAVGNNRKRGRAEGSEPLLEFLKRSRFAFTK